MERTWKVFGRYGHRQRGSFWDSRPMQMFPDGTGGFSALCADKTGTNDYVVFTVQADTAEQCEKILEGQLSDGYFENCRVGKLVEVLPDGTERLTWQDWTHDFEEA